MVKQHMVTSRCKDCKEWVRGYLQAHKEYKAKQGENLVNGRKLRSLAPEVVVRENRSLIDDQNTLRGKGMDLVTRTVTTNPGFYTKYPFLVMKLPAQKQEVRVYYDDGVRPSQSNRDSARGSYSFSGKRGVRIYTVDYKTEIRRVFCRRFKDHNRGGCSSGIVYSSIIDNLLAEDIHRDTTTTQCLQAAKIIIDKKEAFFFEDTRNVGVNQNLEVLGSQHSNRNSIASSAYSSGYRSISGSRGRSGQATPSQQEHSATSTVPGVAEQDSQEPPKVLPTNGLPKVTLIMQQGGGPYMSQQHCVPADNLPVYELDGECLRAELNGKCLPAELDDTSYVLTPQEPLGRNNPFGESIWSHTQPRFTNAGASERQFLELGTRIGSMHETNDGLLGVMNQDNV